MHDYDSGPDPAADDEPRLRTPDDTSRPSERFARSVLDGLSAHVAVLDASGTIVATNEAWKAFAGANGADPGRVSEGADYLGTCTSAAGPNAEGAAEFVSGIMEVLGGRKERFELEYPCHSPTERRWFVARVSRLPEAGPPRAVVTHEDITDRRLREEERARRRLSEAEARTRIREQRQIGRELHDRVAHTMALVHQSIQLHEALRERDSMKAAQKLELAKRMAAEAIEQTRDLSRTLTRGEAADGLEAALSELLPELVPPGMSHELSVEGDEEAVAPEVREQLFLVLREAVRNAVTHSGASKVGVAVEVEGDRIVGVVEDEGRGFEPATVEGGASGGLAYMAQRASLLGGTCSVDSAPGGGTRVEATFPLDGAEHPAG
jgi:signal transduction histidine kinase